MINSLTASASAGLNHTPRTAELSLAVMQADMAAALKNKQQNHTGQKSNLM